jgi:HlyD family secretion protein
MARAPRDGLVVYVKAGGEKSAEKVQLGMIPFEGQPIIYLPDISTMVADTEANEIDIGKVTVGVPLRSG